MSRPTRHEVRVSLKAAIVVLLALVIPAVVCYGCYAVAELRPERAGWAPALALAVPATVLSALGLCAAMLAAIPRPRRVRAWAAVLLVSASLVLVAEMHAFGF